MQKLYPYCIFLLVSFLINLPSLQGQDYLINQRILSLKDGLPDRRIKGIAQDNRGFMWLATRDGLCRFDGYTFKVFNKKQHGLHSTDIQKVVHAPNNLLWLIHQDNTLEFFDPLHEKVIPSAQLLPPDFDQSRYIKLSKNHFLKVGQQLWFTADRHLFCFENDSLKTMLVLPDSLRLRYLTKGLGEQIWVEVVNGPKRPSSNGILLINLEGKLLDQTPLFPSNQHHHCSQALRVNKKGGLHFFVINRNQNDLLIVENKIKYPFKRTISDPALHGKDFQNQRYNPALQQYWCSKEKKDTVYILDLKGEELCQIPQLLNDKNSSHINDIYFDSLGGAWLTRLDLTHIDVKKNKFTHYLQGNGMIRAIWTDTSRRIFANTSRGLKAFYPKNSTIPLSQRLDLKPPPLTTYNSKGYATPRKIDGFWEKEHGLWLTGRNPTITLYNPYTGRQTMFNYPKKTSGDLSFNWILHRKKTTGRLWLGRRKGLSYVDEKNKSLHKVAIPAPYSRLSNSVVWHIYENNQATYICSDSGIFIMDAQENIVAHYCENCPPPYQLAHNRIAHMYEEMDGSFWLASKRGGLIHWHPQTGYNRQYNLEDGLSNMLLYSVEGDDFGKLWLSTHMGLMSFDKNSKQINIYHKQDGILQEEFNTISTYKAKDGTIYFGGIKGITAFHPKDFHQVDSSKKVPLRLTAYKKYDESDATLFDVDSFYFGDDQVIRVLPQDHSVQLSFALLNFSFFDQNKYAFKVQGFDRDWRYQKNRTIELANLPYGKFELWVRAQDHNGNWSEVLKINIHVITPFHLQLWFFPIFLGIIFLGIRQIVQFRLKHLNKQKLALQNLVAERTTEIAEKNAELEVLNKTKDRFFAIVAHDLKSSVSAFQNLGELINFYIEYNKIDLLKKMANDVNHLSDNLSNLLNNLLQWSLSQLDGITIKPEAIVVQEELLSITNLYQNNALAKAIELSIDCPADLQIWADRDSLRLILRNLLNNAIKFTPQNGLITLRAFIPPQQDSNTVEIQIQDNGIGIPKEKLNQLFDLGTKKSTRGTANEKGTGLGIILCQDFAQRNQGHIAIESEVNQGTTCKVTLPLAQTKVENEVLSS